MSNSHDLRTEKLGILHQRFPRTLDSLAGTKEFDILGRQLSLEGYKDWEILQAGCNMVMSFRIGADTVRDPKELTGRLKEYGKDYARNDELPLPRVEIFTLKRVRQQIHADRLARMGRSEELTPPLNEPISIGDVGESREPKNCIYVKTKDNFHLWAVLFPKHEPGATTLSISEE